MNYPYVLPTLNIVAGSATPVEIQVLDETTGAPYDLTGASASLAVTSTLNKSGEPQISKSAFVEEDIVNFNFSSAETLELAGSFVYQITIEFGNGRNAVLQGILHVYPNVDKGAES